MSNRPITPFAFDQQPAVPALADLVEAVWTARGTISYGRERILPTPTAVLIVNLGSPFCIRGRRDGPEDPLRQKGWLVGPQTGYVHNQPLAETEVVGATLRPWGPAALFDLAAEELRDRVVDLEAIWGPGFEELRERLAARSRAHDRQALLTEALLERRRSGPPPLVGFATARLSGEEPSSVAWLTGELRVSRKHLNHLFDRYVGLSPRGFSRVHRFGRALRVLGVLDPPTLATVAHDLGYYDQSHLNRDFAAFAGLTPTEYRRLRSAHLTVDTDDSGLFVPGI